MSWTPMQLKAVEHPVCDILVTAAAGSGKTRVLTGRILNKIRSGGDISRLLVITFTNAAAAEMRSRISKNLTEAVLSETDPKKKRRLERQLSLADTADISTLHSFCLRLLRSYFYKLDLDPAFSLISTYDRKIMLSESLSEAVTYFYDTNNSDFLELINLLCDSKNDDKIAETISAVRDYALSTPYPFAWLDKINSVYENISEGNDPFSDILTKKAVEYLKEAEELLQKSVELSEESEGLSAYTDKFSEELSHFTYFLNGAITWDSLFAFFSSAPFGRAPVIKKECDEKAKAECKALRDRAKAIFDKKAAPLIDVSYKDALNDTVYMKKYVFVITEAAKKAIEIYDNKKREKNVLDFDDLEHLTIRLLSVEEEDGRYSPSETADEIAAMYDEIYVDEYQDINDIQETIISFISSERHSRPNVFMVGDMKQSIYRFRHTDPERIFGAKASSYKNITSSSPSDRHIKIPLSYNFRSHPEVIDAINSVFDLLMSKKNGGVIYEGDERLTAKSSDYTKPLSYPAASLNIFSCEDGNSHDRRAIEAEYVAKRIKELIDSGIEIFDKDLSGYRKITYRDIAVLMRTPKNRAGIFQASMKKHSIPVLYDAEYNFFDSKEIVILTSLLRITDNPLQDIDLIAVMRSPLFNFSENELAHISLYKEPYFYQSVCDAAYDADNPNKKCLRLVTKLNKWRKEASLSTAHDFISRLIEEEGYMSYVSSMPDSDIHIANINIFLNFAKKSDSSSYQGLFNFLKYVDELYTTGGLDKEGADISDIDAVRIMSIHKSKGLEFPYVFLCDTDSAFNRKDSYGALFLDRDIGLGINAYYPDRLSVSSPMTKLIASQSDEASVSEEMRILYVALTRAREYLEITGCIKLTKKNPEFVRPEPTGRVLPSEISFANSFLDWLLIVVRESDSIALNSYNYSAEDEEEQAEENVRIPAPLPYTEAIDKILGYSYPDVKLFSVKNKYSVSELKSGISFEDEKNPPLFNFSASSLAAPKYLNSDKVFTSMQKGSIMHYVAEHLDFNTSCVRASLEQMNLTEQELAAADETVIRKFLSSDIAERARKSDGIFREVPFTFSKKLSELDASLPTDKTVLVQGIIDCYFIENRQIVLLDYKTDKNLSREKAISRYRKQLELYAEALEKKFNMPVKEKYLYLFDTGSFIGV